jgi:HTH-type transcriptional regulator, transcriptional repressor of NAD biosynthesis genes
MKRGLYLGKFAPLHKGHQYVIETALKEVDELIVFIYDCTEIETPLKVRANWIRKLYPACTVIECRRCPQEVGDTPAIKRMHEQYILKKLSGAKIDIFYSNEFYGEHVSKTLKAKDRRIDPDRNTYPISATTIRKDPFKHRAFINPIVYRDLIKNVVFLGAMSTGKSTITKKLAKEYSTNYMPEYGAAFWIENNIGGRLTRHQLKDIAEGHLVWEDMALLTANRYLFTDTNALTTHIFSMYYHAISHPRLVRLAKESATRYQKVFLCDIDIPFVYEPGRETVEVRLKFHRWYKQELSKRGIPYTLLSGDLKSRINLVKASI